MLIEVAALPFLPTKTDPSAVKLDDDVSLVCRRDGGSEIPGLLGLSRTLSSWAVGAPGPWTKSMMSTYSCSPRPGVAWWASPVVGPLRMSSSRQATGQGLGAAPSRAGPTSVAILDFTGPGHGAVST